MLRSELSAYDVDNMSFCDSSVYVLPPKTELNRSFYVNESDSSFIYGKECLQNYVTQRKVGNNVDIPTYKGFSIANGYSTNAKKTLIKVPSKNGTTSTNKHFDKLNRRKVHISNGYSNNNELSLMKKSLNIKNKSRLNDDKDHLNGVQTKEKSVKRTETFLGDVDHYAKRTKKIVKGPLVVDKENSDQRLSNDKHNIKNYINDKRMLSKKLMDENKLLEREKKIIIENRLKLLSQKVKVLDKQPRSIGNNINENMPIDHHKKEMELEKSMKRAENNYKTSEDDFSTDSEILGKSIKLKLAQWKPMEVDELEMHKLASQNYMHNAINTNRHADNILSDIITIADKIQLTKQELFKFTDGRISGLPLHCNQSNRKVCSETRSLSESSSIESSNKTEENSYLSDFRNQFTQKRAHKDNIKKVVTPSILANRARRKLDIGITHQDVCKDDESDSTLSDHDNRIARLIEENKIRYEQSVEKHQPIMLPNASVPSPQTKETKHSFKHRNILKAFETDSLTFMRTYRRCKYSSNFEYKRKSKTSVEVSMTSHDSANISNSNRNSHSTIQEMYNSRSGKINNILEESNDDLQFTNPSERSKPVSASNRDTLASHQSSHDYSEMEIVIENSETLKYEQLKHHQISPKKMKYQSSELRMSPNSLERQLLVEMHYHDSLQASMEQLLQAERFQGVGFAQQETVSLAHILKARQWKDAREVETNENLLRFTSALENLNKMSSYHHHKRVSSTSSDESSTITTDNTSKVASRRGASTTESEASEIEEDIVDVYYSNESQHHSDPGSNYRSTVVKPDKLNAKVKHQGLPVVASKQKEIKKIKYPVVELDLGPLNNDESIQEVSTALSISKGSNLESVKQSSKDSSIIESIDTPSITAKSTSNDQSKDSEILNSNTDQSVTKSIKTDSNFMKSQNTTKEISTAKSFESEKKSHTSKSDSKSKSRSKSTTSISTNPDHYANKSDLSATNYSEDKFETNSDYQKSTSESEVVNRVDILEREKERKQKLVDKLKHKLSIVKHRHKEKSLQNYINHLDSQIDTLKDELKNPNLSLSSMSLSPVTKPKKIKKAKEILSTFNRKSSSSSSTISKDDIKSVSVTGSISSSTLVSDQIMDKPSNGYDKIDNKRIEDADTPRSSKQIQFEDINEEYSASNQDSSDLQTPSEKSRFSKEVTDNGATKSKSENFHILIIDKQKNEDDPDSVNRENEDLRVISARTIHSEISEIPMEGELSDQEIDDFFDKNDESEKHKNNSYGDLYSEDFSDVKNQQHSKLSNTNYLELNEISSHDEKISYEPSPSESSHSSDSIPPEIPVRRKFIIQSANDISAASVSDKLNEQVLTVSNICSHLFKTMFDEIMSEELVDKPVSKPVDLLLEYSDIKIVHPGQSISPAEDSLLNASNDSLNDQPTDPKFEPLRTLISWNDVTILPLVDIAIEQLFRARQMRQGKTSEAFSNCLLNVPDSFKEINSDAEVTRIYNHWIVYRARDKDKIDIHNLFISRSAIYAVVVEIMNDIYELDDLPQPSPWMDYAHNAMLKKKLVLWQGQNAPSSLDLVTQIVRKQLSALHILSSPKVMPFQRSRQHQWFAKQALDYVDKLLIDETFQDDNNWQNYDNALEKTIYMITDDFLANEILDIISSIG